MSKETTKACPECDGTGEIERNIDGADVMTVCAECNGTGEVEVDEEDTLPKFKDFDSPYDK